MARRSLWLATGVVAGAASTLYAERKLKRTLDAAAARLAPDALAVEVGRNARQAAQNTGERVRGAVAAGRQAKKRREAELWTELSRSEWERSLGSVAVDMTGDMAVTDDDDVTTDDPTTSATHLARRRLRRTRRNTPSHLGK